MSWRRLFGSAERHARRVREMALTSFRAELDAASTAAMPELRDGLVARLAARADELGLTEERDALELEMIDGLRELAALVQAVERDGLPLLETQHRVLTGETCRFSAPVTRVDGAEGTSGRLFLTDRRTVFLGPTLTSVPWSGVVAIARTGRDVELSGPGRRHTFRFNTFADALRASWLADRLR